MHYSKIEALQSAAAGNGTEWGTVAEWAGAAATFAAVVVALWISRREHRPSVQVKVSGPGSAISAADFKEVVKPFVTITAANTGRTGISAGAAGLSAWPPKDKSKTLFLIATKLGHDSELPGRIDVFGSRTALIDWQTVKQLREHAETAWWWPFRPRMRPFVNLDAGGQIRGRAIKRKYFNE